MFIPAKIPVTVEKNNPIMLKKLSPGRKSGLELLRRLNSEYPITPCSEKEQPKIMCFGQIHTSTAIVIIFENIHRNIQTCAALSRVSGHGSSAPTGQHFKHNFLLSSMWDSTKPHLDLCEQRTPQWGPLQRRTRQRGGWAAAWSPTSPPLHLYLQQKAHKLRTDFSYYHSFFTIVCFCFN